MILFYHEFSPSLFNFASTGKFLPIPLIPLSQHIGPRHMKGPQLQRHQGGVLPPLLQSYLSATEMLSGLPLQATELFTQTHPHSCIHIVQCLLWLPDIFIDKMFNKIPNQVWDFFSGFILPQKRQYFNIFLKKYIYQHFFL